MMKRRKKIILWLGGIAILGVVLLVVSCNLIVAWDSNGKTYDSVSQIPHNRVGLLLATSPITPGGAHNFYFNNRIKAADELYKAGKIDYIIASGGIFLAGLCQIKAVGYNAAPSHIRRNRIKNTLREYLARVKMFGTIIFATTPVYQEDETGYRKIHQEAH